MSHIHKIKRKKGYAHRVYWQEGGKQRDRYFPASVPLSDVKAWVKKKEAENVLAGNRYVMNGSYTLLQALITYEKRRHNEIDTERAHYALVKMMKYFGADCRIESLDDYQIHQWRDHMLKEKVKDGMEHEIIQKKRRGVNIEMHNAKSVFNWMVKKKLISFNPFDGAEKLTASKPSMDILRKAEIKAVRKYLPKSDIRLIYYILRFTGIRRNECLSLRRKHINLKYHTIKLVDTKNGKVETIPMHPTLHRILKWVGTTTGNQDEFLFDYTDLWVSQAFKEAMKKAGIDKKQPVHIFRHTYITRILKETQNIYLAQKAARHSDIKTTKLYEHLEIEDIKDELNNIKF